MSIIWNIESIVGGSSCALIVLNQPLNSAQCELLSKIWPHAKIRVTVDGGTNRLFKSLPHLIPDLIVGDLDSIQEEVSKHFQERGSKLVWVPDQSFTDFTKSLQELSKCPCSFDYVLTFCVNGGRLDQTMANIKTLYTSLTSFRVPVLLHSGYEITWILSEGEHIIRAPEEFHHGHCGIIPIHMPVTASSRGLMYELDSTKLSFAGLISTSNKFLAQEVTINTDGPVLWTMSLPDDRQI